MNKHLPPNRLSFNLIFSFTVLLAFLYTGAQAQTFFSYNGAFTNVSAAKAYIVGGTQLASGTGLTMDDATYPNQLLGFQFNYNGTALNSVGISTNGFIWFGSSAQLGSNTAPISSGTMYTGGGAVSAFGADLQGQSSASEIRTLQSGTAHAHTFTVQWKNVMVKGSAVTDTIDLWITLHECTNVIEIAVASARTSWIGSVSGQVGLRGVASGDYLNIQVDGTTHPTWASATNFLGNNSSICEIQKPTILPGTSYVNNAQVITYTPTIYFNDKTASSCNWVSPQDFHMVNVGGGIPPYTFNWTCTGASDPRPSSGSATGYTFPNDVFIDFIAGGTPVFSVTVTDASGCPAEIGSFSPTLVTCGPKTGVDSTPPILCLCGTGKIKYTSTSTQPGNIYTVQLSDANGGWGSPITLGTTAGTAPSGYLTITIPCNLPAGTGYRIRLATTNQAASAANMRDNGVDLIVEPYVTATYNIVISPTTVCQGSPINGTGAPTYNPGGTSTIPGPAPTFTWYVNNTPYSTGTVDAFSTTNVNNGDVIMSVMNSTACVNNPKDTSNKVPIIVLSTAPATVTVTPADTVICAGSCVTFTATPGNGGPAPSYQWFVAGFSKQNSTNPVFTYCNFNDGDVVKCVISSSNLCASPGTATSNLVTVTVAKKLNPGVSIGYSPNDPLCTGVPITFTATTDSTGVPPTYQWYDTNGTLIPGATNSTYTTSFATASTPDITCTIHTSFGCVSSATASSTQNVIIHKSVTPTVSINLNPGNSICWGDFDLAVADTTNAGSSPHYQWFINGDSVGKDTVLVGTNSFNLGPNNLKLIFTSNAVCASPLVIADSVTITTTQNQVPSVSVSANPAANVCPGSPVTFTATPTNGGTPTYQWYNTSISNGNKIGGATNATYTEASATAGKVICVMTSSLSCVTTDTASASSVVTVSVPLTPVISIIANPNTPICSGTPITFTADTSNVGIGATFAWHINGGGIAGTGSTFTYSNFVNGDQVTCTVTVGSGCISPSTKTSAPFTVTMSAVIVPKVTINVTAPNPICPSSSITFTATANATPGSYAWTDLTTNTAVGTNSPTFGPTTLSVGPHDIQCIFTSSSSCASPSTATHDTTITVLSTVAASVSVSATPTTNLCPNTPITFTANPINPGTTPVYKWQVNSGAQTTGTSTFATTLAAGTYTVTCYMTSNASCVAVGTVSGNTIVTVNPSLTAAVTLSVNPTGTICVNQPVTLTASVTNGGNPAVYQWQLDGTNVGTNSNIFSVNNLTAGSHIIKCIDTSNALCLTNPNDTASASYSVTVTNNITPSLTVTGPSGIICPGQSISFSTNNHGTGGSNPTYQWYVKGAAVPLATSPTFTPPAIAVIPGTYWVACKMTSGVPCVTTSLAADSVSITVLPNVTASVTASSLPVSPVCQGTPIVFTADTTNAGTAPTLTWSGGSTTATGSLVYKDSTLTPGAPHTITFTMISNANCVLGNPATATVNVTILPTVTPIINISSTYNGAPICPNTPVPFTSTVTSSGTYQWFVNGVLDPAATSDTYSASIATVGANSVKCVITSDNVCPGPPDTSNAIIVNVVNTLPASVTITSDKPGPLCPGDLVTFTATPVNGGTPTYRWQIDSTDTGGSTTTISSSSLVPGMNTIQCIMTSSLSCATGSPDTSNVINIYVNPNVQASVTITSDIDTACAGAFITFTADTVNAGTNPTYQWVDQNNNKLGSSNPLAVSSLNNNDVIRVILTSNAACVTNSPATSTNSITVTINPLLTPSVKVTPDNNNVCEGTLITFTAAPTNGGSSPFYQWFVDNVQQGTNSPTFSSNTLTDGQVVKCAMLSSENCVSTQAPVADSVVVKIVSYVVASITISTADTNVCAGAPVIFNATIQNGGPSPAFDWQLKGVSLNDNSNVYKADSVNDNDIFECVLTSDAQCIHSPIVTSNILIMKVSPIPVVVVTPKDTPTCYGTSVPLTATGADTYTWFPSTGLDCPTCAQTLAHPDDSTIYVVTGTTNNCSSTDTARVLIGCKYIFAPTMFSPNGDGHNDGYRVYGPKIHNFVITIFDRWGEKVFESTNELEEWDGNYHGKPAPQGVYVWVIKGDVAGNKLSVDGVVTGDVTLIR